MKETHKQSFGVHPSTHNCDSPLQKGCHPELDAAEFLDEDDTQKHQSMIGATKWAIAGGRSDIQSLLKAALLPGHLI